MTSTDVRNARYNLREHLRWLRFAYLRHPVRIVRAWVSMTPADFWECYGGPDGHHHNPIERRLAWIICRLKESRHGIT